MIGATNTFGDTDISAIGYYVFAGYGVTKNIEAVARFETFDRDTEIDDNQVMLITFGGTYSIFNNKWGTGKITAAYALQSEGDTALYPEIDNNLFQLVMQLLF